MTHAKPLIADDFLELLQHGERWIELEAGELIRHDPPDDAHGNVVRNLGRALSVHARKEKMLAPCFDLGLILARNPDAVFCPAISMFPVSQSFAEADKLTTETVPQLIIEIASTNDRRRRLAERVQRYLEWGVPAVWVFDPHAREVHQFHAGEPPQRLRDHEMLRDFRVLPGFTLPLTEAFVDPNWMARGLTDLP